MVGPGVLCGCACHIISKSLAGSMLQLVGSWESSRIYIYIVPESSRADFGVNKSL